MQQITIFEPNKYGLVGRDLFPFVYRIVYYSLGINSYELML